MHNGGIILPEQLRILRVHPTIFERREIEAYEKEILSNTKATEHDASHFFFRFPKFLFMGAGSELRREVVVTDPADPTKYRIDFFRKPFLPLGWDVLELKSPKLRFTKSSGNSVHASPALTAAIGQAKTYRDFLTFNTPVRVALRKIGIEIYRPRLIVIVGRRGKVSIEEVSTVMERVREQGIEALSYDDILDFARQHYAATGTTIVLGNVDESVRFESFSALRLGLLDYPLSEDHLEDLPLWVAESIPESHEFSSPTSKPLVRELRTRAGTVHYLVTTAKEARSLMTETLVHDLTILRNDDSIAVVLGFQPTR